MATPELASPLGKPCPKCSQTGTIVVAALLVLVLVVFGILVGVGVLKFQTTPVKTKCSDYGVDICASSRNSSGTACVVLSGKCIEASAPPPPPKPKTRCADFTAAQCTSGARNIGGVPCTIVNGVCTETSSGETDPIAINNWFLGHVNQPVRIGPDGSPTYYTITYPGLDTKTQIPRLIVQQTQPPNDRIWLRTTYTGTPADAGTTLSVETIRMNPARTAEELKVYHSHGIFSSGFEENSTIVTGRSGPTSIETVRYVVGVGEDLAQVRNVQGDILVRNRLAVTREHIVPPDNLVVERLPPL